MPEAELLAYVVCAGLPKPDVNHAVEVAPGVGLTPDLRFAEYGQVVEYEGGQHQDDRAQYVADIDRYALYRRHDVPYELVTKERMRSPRPPCGSCMPPWWQGIRRSAAGLRGAVGQPVPTLADLVRLQRAA